MPFRFLDFHPELCRQILEYTDLVAPFRRIRCGKGKLHVCLRSYSDPRWNSDPPPTDWQPPTALFLVSHTFSALAQAVFLSRNLFKVFDGEDFDWIDALLDSYEAGNDVHPQKPDVSDAANFLSCPMRSRFLSSMRSVEIEWPAQLGGLEESQSMKDWQATIKRYEHTWRPQRLVISINACRDEKIALCKEDGRLAIGLRRGFYDRAGIIDVVRQSVEMFWPAERLAQPDNVQMFVWLVRSHDTQHVAYFCRHQSEELPSRAGCIFLHGWKNDERFEPAVVRWQRPFKRHRHSNEEGRGDQNMALETSTEIRSQWIEGIFMQPAHGDPSWMWADGSCYPDRIVLRPGHDDPLY